MKAKKITLYFIYTVSVNENGEVVKTGNMHKACKDEEEARKFCEYTDKRMTEKGFKYAYFKEEYEIFNYAKDLIKEIEDGFVV